ncbi:MAG: hypothetical protein V1852_33830 [Pseudomonadota bacterium]
METTIEDKYEIVLTATYETDVPAPVVVAEPASISLPEMQTGEVITGEIRFINYGLITAQNLDLQLPEDDENFKYEYMVSSLPNSLEAKQVFTVPYRVICKKPITNGSDGGAGAGACSYAKCVKLKYCWPCINAVWACGDALSCITYAWPCSAAGGGYIWGFPLGGPPGVHNPTDGIVGEICPPGRDCDPEIQCCETTVPSESQVDLMNGQYMDDVMDMAVKIPGGMFEIKRYYYDDQWHFRDVNSKLEFTYEMGGSGALSAIHKNGLLYKKADETGSVFAFKKKFRIRVIADGYRWEDNHGNWQEYTADGLLRGKGDGNGPKTAFSYSGGRLSAISDPAGRQIISLEYDGVHLVAASDYTSRRVAYEYTDGRLSRVIDLLGHETLYTYDDRGRLTRKQLPGGHGVTITYNSYNYVTSVLDENLAGQ